MTTKLTFEKYCQEHLKKHEHVSLPAKTSPKSQLTLKCAMQDDCRADFREFCQEDLHRQFAFKCTEIMTIELAFVDYTHFVLSVQGGEHS